MEALQTETDHADDLIEIGDLMIHTSDGLVLAAGRAIPLSVREFELLVALARSGGQIVSRERLYEIAWRRELRAGDRSVDVYIRKLRVKLEDAFPGLHLIHTHVGFGYRFAVEALTADSHPFHKSSTEK